MSAVDERSGSIARPEVRPFAEVQRGYTYFEEGDVLFAKITPCMQNGKHVVARNLDGGFGFGTTEFHVLRPGAEVISEWIYHFLRQSRVLQAATEYFTGAVGQQRLPLSYLENLTIPLAPRHEQERIVAMLADQLAVVERARAATDAQLDAANTLPAAYLREMFDSPEAKQWPKTRLGEVIRQRQEVVHPHDKPSGRATFVGLEHIEPATGRRIGSLDVEMSELTGRKPRFCKGDIVYGYLRPYLNKLWAAEFDGLCSVDQYVYSVDPKKADTCFIASFMRSPVYLERAPVDVTPGYLPRIRTEEVASVELNLPPLPEQHRIAAQLSEQMASAERLRRTLTEQLDAINALPAALLRLAFTGEL